MRFAEADEGWLRARLADEGVGIDFGAARARIVSSLPALAPMLRTVYGAYPIDPPDGLYDVTVRLQRARGLRAWWRPQVVLTCDGVRDLEPFPLDTPLPLLEWGTNYALASRLYCDLLLHAGVVERGGRAVVMPALPGSGKSTLTAALSLRGFRLLSDEFGVVRLADARLVPMLRPVALKNASIDVIGRLDPQAVIGPRFPKTHKGTVAHLAPLPAHVDARHVPADPGLVIFPQFVAGAGVHVEPVGRARAFARVAVNAFNYDVLGPDAFDALGRLIHASTCWRLHYGDLDAAIETISRLLEAAPPTGTAAPPADDGAARAAHAADTAGAQP